MNSKLQKLLDAIIGFLLKPHHRESYKLKESKVADFLFLSASSLLFWFFSLFFLSAITFLFNGNLSKMQFVTGTVLVVPFTLFSAVKIFKTKTLLIGIFSLFFTALLALGSLHIASKFYDLSYDGQAYHQEMNIFLKEGWNPFYNKISPEDSRYARFLNHYPKASETIDATLYTVTKKIELSKAFNFLFIAMASLYVVSVFLRFSKVNTFTAVLLSSLIILNPVNIYQSLSFYIDGRIYNLILSFISIIFTTYLAHRNYYLLPFILIIPLMLSFKVTLVVYTSILLFFYFAYLFYTERIGLLFKSLFLTISTTVFTIFVLNFNPYLTNLITNSHAFYPAFGKNSTDYTKVNAPNNLLTRNSVEKLTLSTFSRSNNAKGERHSELKIPFTFTKSELSKLVNTGNNIGGFGVLFGGIILITTFAMFGVILFRNTIGLDKNIVYFISIVMISVVINPASFYARFVPQFWIIPSAIAIIMLTNSHRILKLTGFSILILMLFNSFIIANEYFSYQHQKSQELRNELNILSGNKYIEAPKVDFDLFRSARFKLEESGVTYNESNDLDCAKKVRLFKGIIDDSKIEMCAIESN